MLRLWRRVRSFHRAYFSRPAALRPLYRAARRSGTCKMLLLGVGDASLAESLIDLASTANPRVRVEFTGVDLFELRRAEDAPGVSLKLAHRRLSASGARVRLLPGDPYRALASSANSLGGQHLVVIRGDQDADSLARAWFYLPRVLAAEAMVFVETTRPGAAEPQWQTIPAAEVEQLAGRAAKLRAA